MIRGPKSRAGLIAKPKRDDEKGPDEKDRKRTRLHAERRANTKDSEEHDQWNKATRYTASLVGDCEHDKQ